MKQCAILVLVVSCLAAASRAAEPDFSILENNVLRVRVSHLTDNFTAQIQAAEPTNSLAGTILDLRFADGPAAAATGAAWPDHKSPLVILVGRQTRGAALAWAEQLRRAGAGIVIGDTNLTGQLQPDIPVAVGDAEEKQFWENPFFQAPTNAAAAPATNGMLQLVDHMSEAELVRERVKDGEEDAPPTPTPRAVPAQPIICDPALARAVDLLKALAALRPAKG